MFKEIELNRGMAMAEGRPRPGGDNPNLFQPGATTAKPTPPDFEGWT
jgi:hypothetical protein